MRIEPIVQMSSVWSGVHQNFAVHLFQDRVTLEQMDELDAIGERWRRRNPGKLVELVVIFPSNNQMTSDERTRMTKLMKRWETERLAAATVILAEGILGAFHRSVLTGLVMLAPPPHPAKVFGNVSDATTWLSPYLSTLWNRRVSPAEVLAVVQAFAAAFETRDVPMQQTAG